MKWSIEQFPGYTVARLTGELDGQTAPELQRALLPLIQEGVVLILNMSEVPYMSSAGMRVLVLLHRQATALGTQLVLLGLRQELQEVLGSTGFLRSFKLVQTLEQALNMQRGVS